jgi:methylmalonyl-CoA mutase cobalamin-binding domain/chain
MGKLSEAFVALDKKSVLQAVQEELNAGRDPLEVVDEARRGLETVGQKFDSGEYFLMELMRAAQIFQAAAEVLNPAIRQAYGGVASKGRVLLGTVAGDIHDLGKNIVKILLECRGVEVIDLGVDVPAEKFVRSLQEHRPQVVGLSALLTASVAEMNKTTEAIEKAGLRDQVRVIFGGGIVGEIGASRLKADVATTDVNQGIKQIEQWIR